MSKIFSNLKGDIYGGLTAGVVALPLALAFGAQTQMGAVAGLYGAIAIGILAAIFGGTPTQVSGPTAPMTVVSAAIILDAIKYAGSYELALPIIIATFFLSGVFQIVFGMFKLGSYIKYLPYPVISGFMSGIGVIIVLTQIFPLLGIASPAGSMFENLKSLAGVLGQLDMASLGIGAAAIALIFILPKFTTKLPSTLVALVVITAAVAMLLPEGQVLTVGSNGKLPEGLPKIKLDFFTVFTDLSHLLIVLEYALTLAALGAIDSLLTSVVADNLTKTKHKSNQELVGQGIGNMGAALIGGLPGAGATMRTVINIKSGGKTKLSGVVAGVFLLAVMLGLSGLVAYIPNALLAGILITVGIKIIDYKSFKHIFSIPRTDAFIMLMVLLLTVFLDLLVAVAVGMIFATVLFMKKISDVIEDHTFTESLRDFSQETPWVDEGDIVDRIGDKVYIKHLEGPLFFGFAARFQDMITALPEIEVVIIRMKRVPYVDQTGLYAMEDALMDLSKQNIQVVFTGLRGQPLEMLKSINIIPDLVPESDSFSSFGECMSWLDSRYHNQLTHRNSQTQSESSQSEMVSEKALSYLKKGNERFVKGHPLRRNLLDQVGTTQSGQYPFAAILSCIDSRIPVEKIFDQGIGDIFNARIAGNFINKDILGSLEFSCKVAGSKLIVVMGHTSCGAVKGACDNVELGNLTAMLSKIKPAVDCVDTPSGECRDSSNIDFVNKVAVANVELAISQILEESPVLKEMHDNKEIGIVGAMYDVKDGRVRFL